MEIQTWELLIHGLSAFPAAAAQVKFIMGWIGWGVN